LNFGSYTPAIGILNRNVFRECVLLVPVLWRLVGCYLELVFIKLSSWFLSSGALCSNLTLVFKKLFPGSYPL
jgi:hypothetical protein